MGMRGTWRSATPFHSSCQKRWKDARLLWYRVCATNFSTEGAMRRNHSTVPRRALQVELEQDLRQLCSWQDVGRKVSATLLVQLLALAATLHASLSAACRRCGVGRE